MQPPEMQPAIEPTFQAPEAQPVVEPRRRRGGSQIDLARRFLRAEAVALLLAWLALMLMFSLLSEFFFSVQNFFNIGRAVAVTLIVASGTTIALIAGAFDLSIAAVMDLAAVITGSLSITGLPAWAAILVGLTAGTLVGVANGIIVTRLRINPIIATLASAGIVRGIAFLLTSGQSKAVADPAFQLIGRSNVYGVPGSLIIAVVVVSITFLILRRTVFGRMVFAIGGNPVASALAGINIDRWRMLFFMASSFAAALAGIVLLSRLGTVIPTAAMGTELNTIAAVILGGTSLAGGAGSVQGTVVGVLILGTLTNGMTLMNIDAYWQAIVAGIVLILAVATDRLRTGGYR
jgi:ribose transport system permease protein